MPDAPTPPSPPDDVNHGVRLHLAYEAVIDEVRSLPASDLITLNIDILAAVSTTHGVLPKIRLFRPRIVSEMPLFDIERFDKLETYALATVHAIGLVSVASGPAGVDPELVREATALRARLVSWVSTLARDGLVNGDVLARLRGGRGFTSLADDVMVLACFLQNCWPTISGKTALEPKVLDRALVVGDKLITANGLRKERPAITTQRIDERQRAFSLLVSTYDQARRAISFLRWNQGDVDEIIPSLYAARHKGRRKVNGSVPPSPTPATSPSQTTDVPVAPVLH